MSPEISAALIAGIVSVVSLIANYIIAYQARRVERDLRQEEIRASEERVKAEITAKREEWQAELAAQERQWQESFRAELRRDLVQESSLETIRARMKLYGDVWKALKVTAGYEWKNLTDPKVAVQQMADDLTNFAYSEVGMFMSDRSRRLLTHLRVACGAFLRDKIAYAELRNRAHLLKHSLRSDLGIITYEYESDLDEIAQRLGRVDDWTGTS